MKVGDCIWIVCAGQTEPTWWWVRHMRTDRWQDGPNCAHVYGPNPFGADCADSYWDDDVLRHHKATLVPEAEIPDHIWAAIGAWGLTREPLA